MSRLAIAILLASAAVPAHAGPPVPTSPKRHGRDTIALNTGWTSAPDPAGAGERLNWPAHPPAEASQPAAGPAIWHWTHFNLPTGLRGQTLRLLAPSAGAPVRVWLNGTKVGEATTAGMPIDFNVTKPAAFFEPNLLAVEQLGPEKSPGDVVCGLTLAAHDEAYLKAVAATGDGLGNVTAHIDIQNVSAGSGDADIDAEITAAGDAGRVVRKTGQHLAVTPGSNVTTLYTSVAGKTLERWSPRHPSLYGINISFHQGDDVLDTARVLFGFRQLAWDGTHVLMNGSEVALKSALAPGDLQTPCSLPGRGALLRETLRTLLTRGSTLVTLSLPDPELLDAADETGMMVVETVPAADAESAASRLGQLIARDSSHPSIVAWRLPAGGAAGAARIRLLDPTRFVLFDDSGPRLLSPGMPSPAVPAPAEFGPAAN